MGNNIYSTYMRKNIGKAGLGVVAMLICQNAVFVSAVLAAAHPAGTNVTNNGTVYMITDDGQRRPYTSAGAFLSYGFNTWTSVAPASTEDMALPEGSFIPPRDGKIVCSDRGTDKGTCYLITNSKRAAFVSAQVFKSLGFDFGKALYGDVSFLQQDADITSAGEQHRPGVLINKNGTIYLVESGGLMGIPSMAVLSTWGYTAQDAVNANTPDGQLSQSSVVSARQGAQLSPGSKQASGGSLYQSYIDTYPSLPTKTISAPQDGALVIDLIKSIENLPSTDFSIAYPYMTANSVDMLTKIPDFKKYLESTTFSLPAMSAWNSKIEVYEGGVQALYTQTEIQTDSGYKNNIYWVCKKENGVWKWDLVGTLKLQQQMSLATNPNDTYTAGTGTDGIAITNAFFSEDNYVNDPETWIFVQIRNTGTTAINKFGILVYFNNIVVIDTEAYYAMQPDQTLYLALPLGSYWKINGVKNTPGQYAAEVRVGLGNTSNETNLTDNKYTATANFSQKPTSSMPNLVGN